ncbi:hypothetical protein [Deinococcus sonorensis]|uniref:Uncharacterized protein n=2 Tax=Deinococcus sonorensis TaxID=309891 RepID=A0AAU7U6M7_9DEIO
MTNDTNRRRALEDVNRRLKTVMVDVTVDTQQPKEVAATPGESQGTTQPQPPLNRRLAFVRRRTIGTGMTCWPPEAQLASSAPAREPGPWTRLGSA